MNEIRVSFDQQTDVRISDGLLLQACDPDRSGWGRCRNCAAESALGRGTCTIDMADDPGDRCCNAVARKDSRDIVWRPLNV